MSTFFSSLRGIFPRFLGDKNDAYCAKSIANSLGFSSSPAQRTIGEYTLSLNYTDRDNLIVLRHTSCDLVRLTGTFGHDRHPAFVDERSIEGLLKFNRFYIGNEPHAFQHYMIGMITRCVRDIENGHTTDPDILLSILKKDMAQERIAPSDTPSL